ncbi:hypothetical protein SCHPADRAFT_897533, partial [Schizopora paradoxa]
MFYNFGVFFGVVGFFAGIFVLCISSRDLISKLVDSPLDVSNAQIVKRGLDLEGIPESAVPSNFTVKPIIPGVTVPWSHLPVLLSALFFAQCIHEAGHAISAGLENLPLHSVGFSLTLALPSAFVALSPSLNELKHVARLRIIAAGAWHNLVLCAAIYLSSYLSSNTLWTHLGWSDISGVGRVVLDVEADSPLRAHLEPGSLIYALDDTSLSDPDTSGRDVWGEFLLAEERIEHSLRKGFCVRGEWYQRGSLLENGHCLDPVPILSPNEDDAEVFRCEKSHDCDSNSSGEVREPMQCVAPGAETHLTRISVGPPLWQTKNGATTHTAEIVLWSGPRSEIWDE